MQQLSIRLHAVKLKNAIVPDTGAMQGVKNIALPRGLDLCQDDVLIGRDDDRQLIALNDSPQSHLELALQSAKGSASARGFHCNGRALWQHCRTMHVRSGIRNAAVTSSRGFIINTKAVRCNKMTRAVQDRLKLTCHSEQRRHRRGGHRPAPSTPGSP